MKDNGVPTTGGSSVSDDGNRLIAETQNCITFITLIRSAVF